MAMSVLEISTGNATLDAIALSSGAATPIRLVEWIVFFGLAVVMTLLRTYARIRKDGLNGMAWDDHLVWLALASYAALSLNVFTIDVVAEGLSNNGMTDKHRWLLANDGSFSQEYQLRSIGSEAQLVKWFLYGLTLWLLKGSLLYFFSGRLTSKMPGAKTRAWFGAGFLLLTWAATTVTVFASCRPFTNYWQIFPNPGVMCQPAISPILIGVFLACNIITDVYLISIPIPVLLKARLRSSQKISLVCLFSCNILITGVSLTRAILMLKDPKINGDGMWDARETFVALVTTNIPPTVPLFRSWYARCLGRPEVTISRDSIPAPDRGSGSPEIPIKQEDHITQQAKDLEQRASASTYSASVYSQGTDEPTEASTAWGPRGSSLPSNNGISTEPESGEQSPVWFRREALRRQIHDDPETTDQGRTEARARVQSAGWPFVTS